LSSAKRSSRKRANDENLAEIVDRQRDAVDVELGGDLVRHGDVLHHLAFGDFEDQAGPVVARRPVLAHQGDDVRRGERGDRGVDRRVEMDVRLGDFVPVAQRPEHHELVSASMACSPAPGRKLPGARMP
jgi:hypothetical protein